MVKHIQLQTYTASNPFIMNRKNNQQQYLLCCPNLTPKAEGQKAKSQKYVLIKFTNTIMYTVWFCKKMHFQLPKQMNNGLFFKKKQEKDFKNNKFVFCCF